MSERLYEFRNRLETVHKADRRNMENQPTQDEIEVDHSWRIVINKEASPLILNVAQDLQHYLLVSMNVSVLLQRGDSQEVAVQASEGDRVIVLGTRDELPDMGISLQVKRSYRLIAEGQRIVVCGHEDRGVGQGSYFLEDLMNLREAPFISLQDQIREPLFSPRMVHSGWGLDHYPPQHLNAMAHAGIDAILVFVKDVDKTPAGYLDFNYVIDQAELYGLDVYMYSYILSRKHPDDEDAEAYYESTYGQMFAKYPRFKGLIFVGESCEFPSKDERTTGTLRLDFPKAREGYSPGWWPCYDYPQWLDMVKKVVRKHNPDLDIVFWTYNWGFAPEEERLRLIRSLPTDVTLQATFEMFEKFDVGGVIHRNVDYTASSVGPGTYFASEAKAAHERGIKLYTMSNTGGLTWDMGVIPYEPIPYQWARRHEALKQARSDWGLAGLMESHHFGWWPSFVSDLTKWAYWSPSPPTEETFAAVAKRDFSEEAVPHVLAAWQSWSEGITHYIPTNYDQYGPFRVGPSYPLVFQESVEFPSAWYAHFGNSILSTNYSPINDHEDYLRINVEIESLERMRAHWRQGNESLEQAIALIPDHKREEPDRLLNMNRFIVRMVDTVIHTKQWWKLKDRLLSGREADHNETLLAELAIIAEKELVNAEETIALVEMDSRLGWEPSMEYMTDAEHLRWKIAQVRSVLDHELPEFRKSLHR